MAQKLFSKVKKYSPEVMTFGGFATALLGGFLEKLVATLIGVMFAMIGVYTLVSKYYSSVQSSLKKFEKVLKMYMPPEVLTAPPIISSKLAAALRKLTQQYWYFFELGEFPVSENWSIDITMKFPNEALAKTLKLFAETQDSKMSWQWLVFEIKESWTVNLETSSKTLWDVISDIIVCDEETYHKLLAYGLLTPKVYVFFPIPVTLSTSRRGDLENRLRDIPYITDAKYTIREIVQGGEVFSVDLKPVDLQSNRSEVIADLLPGFRRIQDEATRESISKGVLQVLRKNEENKERLRGKVGGQYKITFECNYILPRRVIEYGSGKQGEGKEREKIIWEQKWFIYSFARVVVDISHISFCKDNASASSITFEERLRPISMLGIKGQQSWVVQNWQRSDEINNLTCWQLQTGMVEYAYPGDIIEFRWEETRR